MTDTDKEPEEISEQQAFDILFQTGGPLECYHGLLDGGWQLYRWTKNAAELYKNDKWEFTNLTKGNRWRIPLPQEFDLRRAKEKLLRGAMVRPANWERGYLQFARDKMCLVDELGKVHLLDSYDNDTKFIQVLAHD